jgi:hypothetical protein
MKKPMRKILALFLSLMLVLPGTLVFAEESGASDTGLSPMTLEGGISVDPEVVENVAATFGMNDEETLAQIDAVVGLLNALAIKVATAEDGAQLDLELNGESAVSMAAALTEDGAAIVSTLFPNYLITASAETVLSYISQNVPMLGQMMGSSEGGEAGAAPEVAEKVTGYMQEIMDACMANVVPGEPETGEYTIDKYLFNTALPLEVDAKAIAATVKDVLSRMLEDEDVMEMIKGATSIGATVDFDPEEISASLDEIFSDQYIPAVSSTMYMDVDEKGESSDEFYVVTEATYEGDEEASYIVNVYGSSNGGDVELEMPTQGMSISGSYLVDEDGILFLSLYVDYQGMFFGAEMSLNVTDTFSGECNLYIMDRENPAISLSCYLSQEGELTLSADPEGKTEVSLDDLMNDESGEAASGLMDDVMSNGFNNLMEVILTEVPEAAPLFGMA